MNGEIGGLLGSGIIELYVLGISTHEEAETVRRLAAKHHAVRAELKAVEQALGVYAHKASALPDPTVGPFLAARTDYSERIRAGELPQEPPLLSPNSRINDYAKWLNRPDMTPHQPFDNISAKIIGYTPEVLTAIVWLKEGAPAEVHEKLLEKFMIVEGSCEIVINDHPLAMGVGDIITIRLNSNHYVRVTSVVPCKVILQRVVQ